VTAYLLGRLIQSVVLVLVVSAVIFGIVHSAPGGPTILNNPDVDPRLARDISERLGLNDPLPVQYGRWTSNLLRGKLGTSYQYSLPVAGLIVERMQATLLLGGVALIAAIALSIPLGMISAIKRYSAWDYLATFIAFFGVSVPVFWLGLMLIIVFSVTLNALPSSGMLTIGAPFSVGDRLSHLIMPAAVLATLPLAQLTRSARSGTLEVIRQDYVRTAHAKGLPQRIVLSRHVLRNALIPFVTVVAVLIPRVIGGAAITEAVFAWPGMGRLAIEAAFTRDYPLVMGITVVIAVFVVICNLLADVTYGLLDPRIRLGRSG
jgi:peptide/nickel transport system permease protein